MPGHACTSVACRCSKLAPFPNPVHLAGAHGGAPPNPQRVQQFAALISLNATIAAQQIQPAVYQGGSEAVAAAAALLNTTSCLPGTNATEAGPAATFDSIITSLTLHRTDTAPDVVARCAGGVESSCPCCCLHKQGLLAQPACACAGSVCRWLVNLINATDDAGIPACATLISVARHGIAWGYNETAIWTGGVLGV